MLGELGEAANPLLRWEQVLESQQAAVDVLIRQLDRREAQVAQKLIAYHEGMEFPTPVDLNATDSDVNKYDDPQSVQRLKKNLKMND